MSIEPTIMSVVRVSYEAKTRAVTVFGPAHDDGLLRGPPDGEVGFARDEHEERAQKVRHQAKATAVP